MTIGINIHHLITIVALQMQYTDIVKDSLLWGLDLRQADDEGPTEPIRAH
jgi:hypothetical protein